MEKYSSDPRMWSGGPIKDWEDGIENAREAKLFFEFVIGKLEKYGSLSKDTKILEIGSGNSILTKYLQDQGYDAVGLDARPRGEAKNLVAGRIEQLPFPDETFGLILSFSVFDKGVYRQNQPAMVKEIARVLQKGGIYFGQGNWDEDTPFEQHLEVLEKGPFTTDASFYRKQ